MSNNVSDGHDAINMVSGNAFDPFSPKNVLGFGDLNTNIDESWNNLKFDTDPEYIRLSGIEKPNLVDLRAGFLKLQISHEDLQDLSSSSYDGEAPTSYALQNGSPHASTSPEVDVWTLNGLFVKTVQKQLLTWDRFNYPEKVISDQQYITEATAAEFDRFQSRLHRLELGKSLHIANNDALQQALLNLVFGRSSAFFVWNAQTSHFDLSVHDFAISGCSQAASVEICEYFVAFGSRFRRLQEYARTKANSHSTGYAFQQSVERTLHFLELHTCISQGQQARRTYILKEAEKMTDLLSSLEHLKELSDASQSELNFITSFVKEIDQMWVSHSHLRPFFTALLSDVSSPAIRQTREMIGLQQNLEVKADADIWLCANLLPNLAKSVIDVKASVAILGDRASRLAVDHMAVSMYLAQTWADIIELQDSATTLEENSCIHQIRVSSAVGTQFQLNTIENPASSDPFSINFDLVQPTSLGKAADVQHEQQPSLTISRAVTCLLSGEVMELVPEVSPMQAVELSLRPIIEAQNRLTSFAVLKELFVQHELKAHLDALHAFCLFGNGSFAVRLVTALFDSSQESIEGKRKSGLTGGLRLEDREAWPPASSELRLALNGILSETMQATIPSRTLDRISFAIKDLSDEEAELCRDIHSIHALDFLRVTYVPSDIMLESVITSSILEKYDRIFNFMLILLRVHNLCQGLMLNITKNRSRPHSAVYNRLCLEANHFATTLLAYAMNNINHSYWQAFEERLCTISQHVKANNYQKTMDAARSVSQLCQDHASTVDNIIKGLLLKKKQGEAFALTCDILNLFLKLSSDVRSASNRVYTNDLYGRFCQLRKKWFSAIQAICDSTSNPAFFGLRNLLLQVDLSGALNLSD